LTEEQLKQPVKVAPEDNAIFSVSPAIIEEDMYAHVDDFEDCGTLDELRDLHGDFEEDEESDLMMTIKKVVNKLTI
jgi:hypothetical protein